MFIITPLKDALNELNSDLSANNITSYQEITSYNTSDNWFTCPSDGYIKVICGKTANDTILATLRGASGSYDIDLQATCTRDNYAFTNAFMVKKGMKIVVLTNTGSRGKAYYYPFS